MTQPSFPELSTTSLPELFQAAKEWSIGKQAAYLREIERREMKAALLHPGDKIRVCGQPTSGKVLAVAEGYAMVRYPRAMPFVIPESAVTKGWLGKKWERVGIEE